MNDPCSVCSQLLCLCTRSYPFKVMVLPCIINGSLALESFLPIHEHVVISPILKKAKTNKKLELPRHPSYSSFLCLPLQGEKMFIFCFQFLSFHFFLEPTINQGSILSTSPKLLLSRSFMTSAWPNPVVLVHVLFGLYTLVPFAVFALGLVLGPFCLYLLPWWSHSVSWS